jgi:hypothetical protein
MWRRTFLWWRVGPRKGNHTTYDALPRWIDLCRRYPFQSTQHKYGNSFVETYAIGSIGSYRVE